MLDDTQIEAFRRDGFLVLRGAVGGDELHRLQDVTAGIVEAGIAFGRELDARDPVPVGAMDVPVDLDVYFDPGFLYAADGNGHRVFRRAEWLWARDPAFVDLTANPVILNAVWQLLETPFVPTNDSLVVKLPAAGAAVPWHRDVEVTEIVAAGGDPTRDFTVDIYLDPATPENGCLWAIPGSHRGEPATFDTHDWARTDAVLLPAEPGDVFVHATGLLHGSPPNHSGDTRRTVYFHHRGPSGLVLDATEASVRKVRKTEPREWFDQQVAFLADAIAHRAASGLVDPEPYVGPIALPQLA